MQANRDTRRVAMPQALSKVFTWRPVFPLPPMIRIGGIISDLVENTINSRIE
jgi:hypothetical protein